MILLDVLFFREESRIEKLLSFELQFLFHPLGFLEFHVLDGFWVVVGALPEE
jgi:hypothetical protein